LLTLLAFIAVTADAVCTPCSVTYAISVRYTVSGNPLQGAVAGTAQVFDGVLDLNAVAVQSLVTSQLGANAVLTDAVQIKLNAGPPGTLVAANDTLVTANNGVIAWIDAPSGSTGHLHFTTAATNTTTHPFSYLFSAQGTESPAVAFTYTLTAIGNETYHAPTHKEETIAIAYFNNGKDCRSIEGDVCLPAGCTRQASRLDEYIGLHRLEYDFHDSSDRCSHYKIKVGSSNFWGNSCDNVDIDCSNCGAEYKGIVVLDGYCDTPRPWSRSIGGTGHAEAKPLTNFTVNYAAAGGQLGSGLPDSAGVSGTPSYSVALTNCAVGGSPIACTNLGASVSGNGTLTVSTVYAQPASTSKNAGNTLKSTEGVKLLDSLPFTTENGDVRRSVDVTFQGTLYRDVNADGFVDVGAFSFWIGGANNDQLFGAFDRTGFPVAIIDSIAPNPALFGQSVQFHGHGTGPFSSYQWFTHRLDQSAGPLLGSAANIARNDLNVGVHQIRFVVAGTNPSPFTYANLVVNQPPVAFINHIENVIDPAHPTVSLLLHDGAQTDAFAFDGGGVDFDGSVAAYEWSSDLEPGNIIGTAAQFQKSLTTLGTHTIALRVRDNAGVWSAPVKQTVIVRRPPLLLVHGICGASDSWDDIVNNSWLGPQWITADILRPTFDANGDGITNDAPSDNANVVWQRIQQMKQTYGVRTVDVMGHSMGNLDSRAYIQGPAYQGDVNKLVMLAPPNHGSSIADLTLMTNGFSQQDVELYIPIPGVANLLAGLGVIVDIVDWVDPQSSIACLGQDSPALRELRPHSDFIRNLNRTYKDEGTEDFGASGEPADATSAQTQYFVIHGKRKTVSHTHLPKWIVDSIRVSTSGQVDLRHMSLIWSRDGDTVVTAASARLDGVPSDSFDYKHREMRQHADSAGKAQFYLLDDPPAALAADTQNPAAIVGAHILGAGRGSAGAIVEMPPATLEIDAAALRARVSLSWQTPSAAVSQPNPTPTVARVAPQPLIVVLTSPSGVRYSSDAAKAGFSAIVNASSLDATIEQPEPGKWKLQVARPSGIAVSRGGIPYGWFALEESSAFVALGVSSDAVAPGDPVTVAAYVQNNATGVAGVEVRAAVSDGKEKPVPLTFIEDKRVAGLYTAKFTPARSGIYRLLAAAKLPGNPSITRFNFINVASRVLPDLTISLTASAPSANVGDIVTFNAKVDNRGKGAVAKIPVRFFDGLPAERGRLIAERIITLAATSSTTVSVPWTATRAVHRIVAVVDPSNISGETNTADNTANLSLEVKDIRPPIAKAGDDQLAAIGQSVVFDGRASTDDDRIVSYRWSVISGISPRARFSGTLDGGYVALPGGFTALGTYTVRLTVTDAGGNTGTDDMVVRVVPGFDTEPPVAKAGRKITAAVGAAVTFDGSASHDNYGIALATWDIDLSRDSDGDGNPANDQDLAGLSPTLLRGYAKPGIYRARLTVRDAVGNGPSTEEVVVVVGIVEPIIGPVQPALPQK
jgi:hypothetical protein